MRVVDGRLHVQVGQVVAGAVLQRRALRRWPAHAPAARCRHRRRRRAPCRRVFRFGPWCGFHHRRASPSRRSTPRSPSSHISPIVRRGLSATWSFRRLPSNRPVRVVVELEDQMPRVLAGDHRVQPAQPRVTATHLAHQVAEGVDEVHRRLAHQELRHGLEVGLAVQVGARPWPSPGRRRKVMPCTRPKKPASISRGIRGTRARSGSSRAPPAACAAASASAVIASACARSAPKGFWQMVGDAALRPRARRLLRLRGQHHVDQRRASASSMRSEVAVATRHAEALRQRRARRRAVAQATTGAPASRQPSSWNCAQ
jgi:hypothetical protein